MDSAGLSTSSEGTKRPGDFNWKIWCKINRKWWPYQLISKIARPLYSRFLYMECFKQQVYLIYPQDLDDLKKRIRRAYIYVNTTTHDAKNQTKLSKYPQNVLQTTEVTFSKNSKFINWNLKLRLLTKLLLLSSCCYVVFTFNSLCY